MIRDLRPDYVKIDRRLIWNAEQPVCASTIGKLVDVADRYGARVIAVGVERHRMLENLWLLGVQTMQGYLFGRPSPQTAHEWSDGAPGTGSDVANLARAVDFVPRSTAGNSRPNHTSPLFAYLN
jgi:EAL domain-containing protein (putative c-di-GMP-specific phosphodiesterase class I)